MKRKSLLFFLLIALLAPLAMNAQSTQDWGSSSTNSGTNNNANPFGRYYGYEYRVYLYPPNTMPFSGNITQLEFLPYGTLSAGGQIDVWMKTVTDVTSLSSSTTFATYKTGATQVYTSSSSPAFTQGTYVSIPLSTPIAYNYANNEYLMILVRSVANSGSGDGGRSFYYYNPGSASNNTWYAKNDNSDPGESAAPSSFSVYGTGAYLPVVRFTYTGSAIPTISLSPSSATVLTGFTTTLTATCGNVTNPTITYSSSDNSVATVTGSGTTATVTGVAPGTATITATMNGSYTATCAITVEDPHICTPTFSGSYTTYYISNFTTAGATNNINNTTSGTGLSYSDFYNSYSASAYEGQTINFTITIAGGSTYGSAIWVDWNDDLEFSNAERVHQTSGYSSSPHSGSFTVPTGATLGDHRMRIVTDYYDSSPSNPCSASTGEFEDYKLTVTAIPNCLPPTGLDMVANTLTGHEVTMSWNAVATNINHQSYDLFYSTNATLPQTIGQQTPGFIPGITATQQQLTGLDPETTYYVWVRDNCGSDGFSSWSESFSFITDIACPAPTNVAANHVTNNSATISWTGNADSYNVRYRINSNNSNPIFFEGFEEGLPSTWTTIDADGDGFNWDNHINTGSGNYTTHTGDGVAISASYDNDGSTALTPDNWLITPQLDLQGTMKVWLCGQDKDDYYEHFAIYLSTNGTSVADFTTVLVPESVTTHEMVEFTADLSEYAGQQGYIAIRHFNCTDQFWLNVDDFGIYPSEPWNTASSSILTGLTSETEYEVQVQANCGSEDGTSAWVGTTFTTLDDCAVPYELEVANPIAPTSTLTWTGAQDNYNVRYRTETFGEPQEYVFEEGFEDGSMPTGWTTTGSDWIITSGTGNSSYTGSATGNYNAGCYISSYSGSDILITPAIDLSQATSATLTFNFWNTSWSGDINTLNVYYRVDGGNWSNALYTNNSQVTPWTSISVTLPSSGFAANYQIGFECVSNYSYGMGIDDVKITYTAPSIIYGEWVNKPNVTSPLDITNLTPGTTYEWQVQGVDCDGNGTATEWSAPATFTTLEGYALEIKGYNSTTNPDGTINRGGYYLIASPIGGVAPTEVANMIPTDPNQGYDLYRFDHTQDNEWINYKTGTNTPGFSLVSGKGYLYANQVDVTLFFSGTGITSGTQAVALTPYSTTSAQGNHVDFPGWNLVGNPFAVTAWIERDFYTMDADCRFFAHTESRHVEAMEGIFVVVGENEEYEEYPTVTFTTEEPTSKGRELALNLSNGHKLIDRAIVRFDGGRQLPKLQLIKNNTKVYIPVDGQDYAIASCEEMGAMPVNFKAEENGSYTLSLNSENVSFAYLHLVDNLTGNDVDLLQTPSYSFEAKTTDYANRFKLVFATGDNSNDDNFAFFSNGSFVINNEGAATLQVIDIMGRIVKSESINGCTNVNVNAAPGVYMLRLINGDNVKVQKVVVK